ncbi:hypothetical protein [Clostridium sp. DL1XJH146]
MDKNYKIMSIKIEEYVMEIAKNKANLLFDGDLNNYINWLICSNNLKEMRKELNRVEELKKKKKPIMIEGTVKVAMYNNICDYCKRAIYPGDEICQGEGYKNYIHKKCCKS